VHAREAEKFVAYRFEHALLAAMEEVALLNVRPETKPTPDRVEFPPPVVARLQIVSSIEGEFPRVLAHRVAPDTAAHPEPALIVDLSVGGLCACPQIITAHVLIVGLARRPAGRDRNRIAFGDEMINGQAVHFIGADGDEDAVRSRDAGLHRSAV